MRPTGACTLPLAEIQSRGAPSCRRGKLLLSGLVCSIAVPRRSREITNPRGDNLVSEASADARLLGLEVRRLLRRHLRADTTTWRGVLPIETQGAHQPTASFHLQLFARASLSRQWTWLIPCFCSQPLVERQQSSSSARQQAHHRLAGCARCQRFISIQQNPCSSTREAACKVLCT